jgi:hypothetical protein
MMGLLDGYLGVLRLELDNLHGEATPPGDVAALVVSRSRLTRKPPVAPGRAARMPAPRLEAVSAGAAAGVLAGLAGAAAMAAASKGEQLVTHRPDSYVPAHTLGRLLGLPDRDADRWGRNMAMHYGSGALGGAVRGVMSAANLRGPVASLMHTNLRLSLDQTLENLTGAGAPPWTWPRDELAIDLTHKALYSFVTGAICDAVIRPARGSSAERRAWGRRRKGHA